MAEKKETSKRRVLTPEEVEMVTGGAIVRPTDSAALVTMEGGHDKGTGRAFKGGAGGSGGEMKDEGTTTSYTCDCGKKFYSLISYRFHCKTCSVYKANNRI